MRFDPVHNVERLAAGRRPLLMINGGDDTLVPCDANKRLLTELRARYAEHADRVRLTVLRGVGHATPPHMLDEATAFLREHLCGVGLASALGGDEPEEGGNQRGDETRKRHRMGQDMDEHSPPAGGIARSTGRPSSRSSSTTR
jgi:hypothetical protein